MTHKDFVKGKYAYGLPFGTNVYHVKRTLMLARYSSVIGSAKNPDAAFMQKMASRCQNLRKNYDLSHSLTSFVYDEWLERYKAMCALKNARVAILTTIKNKKGQFVTKVSAIRPFKNQKRDQVKPLKKKTMVKAKAKAKPRSKAKPKAKTKTQAKPRSTLKK